MSAPRQPVPYCRDRPAVRVDGGPEVLLSDRPAAGPAPLGPVLMTVTPRAAGLSVPPGRRHDTPVSRDRLRPGGHHFVGDLGTGDLAHRPTGCLTTRCRARSRSSVMDRRPDCVEPSADATAMPGRRPGERTCGRRRR